MTQRVFSHPNWTPTAQADTSALTNATYMAIKGGASTQINLITEVEMGGLAITTSPTLMELARASTLETTPTALAAPAVDGFKNPSGSALSAPAVSFTAAGTGPQRSAVTTDTKLRLTINAFGGILRWGVPETEAYGMVGNTASAGECILSAFTGGTPGAIGAQIVYETK